MTTKRNALIPAGLHPEQNIQQPLCLETESPTQCETLSTIVTCGDKRFFWGMYLLCASMRMQGMTNPVKCLVKGLSRTEESALEAFGVDVHRSEDLHTPLQAQKPRALALGAEESDYVTWMDGDCIVDGDVSQLLLPDSENAIMIRWRDSEENKLRFRKAEVHGRIPETVQETWRRDTGGLGPCRIQSTCVTSVFTLHKSNFDLIELWDKQLQYVMEKHAGYYSEGYTHSSGKGISDELVLNSLFAFPSSPYTFSPYRMDRKRGHILYHFCLNPKPWEMWTLHSLRHYDLVFSILRWAESRYSLNLRYPWSLWSHSKPVTYSVAYAYEVVRRAAHTLRK